MSLFEVMEDALIIFAIMERGQDFQDKERRTKAPHPDGDMHSLHGRRVELLQVA